MRVVRFAMWLFLKILVILIAQKYPAALKNRQLTTQNQNKFKRKIELRTICLLSITIIRKEQSLKKNLLNIKYVVIVSSSNVNARQKIELRTIHLLSIMIFRKEQSLTKNCLNIKPVVIVSSSNVNTNHTINLETP